MAVCAQLMILVLSLQWRWLLLLWIHREVCCCTGRWQLDPQLLPSAADDDCSAAFPPWGLLFTSAAGQWGGSS